MRRFGALDSLHHVPPPSALSALSRPELEALLVELFGKIAALEKVVGEQREEIARLKGLKGRPDIKPSGMDKATDPSNPTKTEKRPGRGKITPAIMRPPIIVGRSESTICRKRWTLAGPPGRASYTRSSS